MKKSKFIFILLAAAVLVAMLVPATALADDDDFDVRFEINPQDIGFWGGVAQLLVTVTNAGDTDITWINVAINNERSFSAYWTGTITPGHSRTISFSPRFAAGDLEVPRILQVSMNNNSNANADGVKMMNFQVGNITDIFDVSCTISPAQSVYRPGETVTITHSFKNNVETNAALNTHSTITMMIGSRHIYDGTQADLGDVLPGRTVTSSFRYTFGEDDEGTVNIYHRLNFTLMDQAYDLPNLSRQLEVRARTPSFSAALYADPLTVAAGDPVNFRIAIGNTSDFAIGRFEVTDTGGATVAEAEGLPAGGAGSLTLSEPVYETGDFSYVVTGTTGTVSRSLETNTVHITVESEPESSAAPGSSSPASSGVPAAPSGSATLPGVSSAPGSASPLSSPPQSTAASSGTSSAGGPGPATGFPVIYILLGVIAAVVVIIVLIVLKKRKKNL